MEILIISPYLPYPNRKDGGGSYTYGLIEELSKKHNVTVVAFADSEEEEKISTVPDGVFHRLHIVKRPKNSLIVVPKRIFALCNSVLRWEPYFVSKFRNRKMCKLIKRVTSQSKFDAIQIMFTQMAQYRKYCGDVPTYLMFIDVMTGTLSYNKSRSVFSKLEWKKTALYERRCAGWFDHSFTLTEQDKELLVSISGNNNVTCVPVGVNPLPKIVPFEERQRNTVVFIGSNMRPNNEGLEWFIRSVLPYVKNEMPNVTVLVVGSVSVSDDLKKDVTVVGYVTDVDKMMNEHGVLIVPVRSGGGIKTRVIRAVSNGMVVVSTSVGVQGIVGLNKTNTYIADDDVDFAKNVVASLKNPLTSLQMAKRARKNVLSVYGFDKSAESIIAKWKVSE